MNDAVPVTIRWLDIEWLRKRQAASPARIACVARFAEENTQPESMAGWGIVAELDQPWDGQADTRAHMSFFVSPGSAAFLHPGSRFDLYDGAQPIARGEIVTQTEPAPASAAVIKESSGNSYMSTAEPQPTIEGLRAELAEKEDQLRRLLRLYDQISRTEFRDRAQRLKAMRTQREDLEKEIAALKQHLATHE